MAAHGFPRATGDLDIWVRCSAENSQRVGRALADFGAPLAEVTPEDLRTGGVVVQIGVAPTRIDLLTTVDGLEFDEAWVNRTEVEMSGITAMVVSIQDLIRNKRASGRPRDLADVAWIERQEGEQ